MNTQYVSKQYAKRIERRQNHYQSDVDTGRLCANVGYAAIHSSEAFQKQMAKAKKEIAKILATK